MVTFFGTVWHTSHTTKKVKMMKKYTIMYECKGGVRIATLQAKKLKDVVKMIDFSLLPCEIKIYKFKKGLPTRIKDSKIVSILEKLHN